MTGFVVDVATCNDDWATEGSNIEEVLGQQADVVGIQEGKRANYRKRLPIARFGVHQDTSSKARAGSVVVWDHHASMVAGRAGWTFGVKAPGLLARFVAYVVFHPAKARRFAFLSAHWPPMRDRRFWHPFEIAVALLVRWFRVRGILVVIACDSNQHHHRRVFAGLQWHSANPDSIDGFWTSPEISVETVRFLPHGSSDHRPQVARMVVPARRPA